MSDNDAVGCPCFASHTLNFFEADFSQQPLIIFLRINHSVSGGNGAKIYCIKRGHKRPLLYVVANRTEYNHLAAFIKRSICFFQKQLILLLAPYDKLMNKNYGILIFWKFVFEHIRWVEFDSIRKFVFFYFRFCEWGNYRQV